MMNSEEALARPFSACTRRKERSGKRRPRYASPSPHSSMGRGEKKNSLLARRFYLGLRKQVFRAVLVGPVLHGAHLALARCQADPGAERGLMVQRPHHHRAGDGVRLQV